MFRAPITPSWEDAANSGGGRFVVRLRKGLADRVFDELVCALACERIPGQDVNGLVLSTRKDEDVVAVWVRSLGRERRESIRCVPFLLSVELACMLILQRRSFLSTASSCVPLWRRWSPRASWRQCTLTGSLTRPRHRQGPRCPRQSAGITTTILESTTLTTITLDTIPTANLTPLESTSPVPVLA